MSGNYERIYAAVRRIPEGRVATYGQVARLAGLPRHARQVGYALHALPDGSDVPWQRVVNAQGAVSPRSVPGFEDQQRVLLIREGVVFAPSGRIPLARYQWGRKVPAPEAGPPPTAPGKNRVSRGAGRR
ncbi:MAG: ybaZ [Elusimicrobia bacterium]|nr:MAG: ybaZ [Elusimicrobiota bacterium]